MLSFAERENRFLGFASEDAKENAFSKESRVTVYLRCLPRGRLLAQFWWSSVVVSRISLDMRAASPRSAQPLPSEPLVGPMLKEFWCAEPDPFSEVCSSHALVARCTSNFLSEECFSHALVATCTSNFSSEEGFRLALVAPSTSKSPPEVCFRHAFVARCTSMLPSEVWFRLALVANAQAHFHLKSVSDLRLWQDAQVCCRRKCGSDLRLWRMHKHIFIWSVFQTCVCGEMHKYVAVGSVVQTCACGECTSTFSSEECFRLALVARWTNLFPSEECFRHALVVIAQAGSRWNRARSSTNLWAFWAPTLVPCTLFSAISSSVSRGTFTTALVGTPAGIRSEGSWSSTALVEDQLEYVRKAADARQHLSDDTDVDQCIGCRVQLLYAVCFQVGRFCARCWRCFNVWPFLGCIRREAASRTSWGACVFDDASQHTLWRPLRERPCRTMGKIRAWQCRRTLRASDSFFNSCAAS